MSSLTAAAAVCVCVCVWSESVQFHSSCGVCTYGLRVNSFTAAAVCVVIIHSPNPNPKPKPEPNPNPKPNPNPNPWDMGLVCDPWARVLSVVGVWIEMQNGPVNSDL